MITVEKVPPIPAEAVYNISGLSRQGAEILCLVLSSHIGGSHPIRAEFSDLIMALENKLKNPAYSRPSIRVVNQALYIDEVKP